MKNRKSVFRTVFDAIRDPERVFTDRVFMGLTLISEVTVFIALIGDIITGENPVEIALLIATLIVVPVNMYVCLIHDKIKIAIRTTVIGIIFFIMPTLFFCGGGLEGGGVLWIIFTFTYVGLVLSGAWRTIMFVLTFILTMTCFLLEYYYPQLVYDHSRKMFFIDSFLSLIMVGIVCFYMTWFQNKLFMGENARAKKAAEKAEELTKAQNRFFSSMSHEIRTPINSILGLNELILRDIDATDKILWDAAGISGSGKMLLSLINDILDYSKIEAGSMDIVPVDYKTGDMIKEVVNMIRLRAGEKGLKFNVTVDPKIPSVLYGDEVRIKQIIVNLVNNAVKYTSEGHVDLNIEGEQKDEKTFQLLITVSDSGMGIRKESLPYLFDAFKRVDEQKNRYIEGTGLGLSIVKQLVEIMNSTINVNSVYGEGSVFTVELSQGVSDSTPVGELNIRNQNVIRNGIYESSFTAPDARILIVDDNELNLEVESRLIADTRIKIDKAASGKKALECTLKYYYDLIFMDHLMPEMDGIECLEQLRNQVGGMNRTTPVIILTANAGSTNRELYNISGFDGYLVKPVSGEMLENMLLKYISSDKVNLKRKKIMTDNEDINTFAGFSGKFPVIITSTSMCDLPGSLVRKLNIPLLPFVIRTEEGLFKDGVHISADEMIRYINKGNVAISDPPDESAYTEFFAAGLKKAHHLIHIALSTSMSKDYPTALEAAKSFDNVTVINSGVLSSATGMLVLIAVKLARMNTPVEEIISELERVRENLRCSFIIDDTEYMARRGYIKGWIDRLVKGLNLHPCLKCIDNRSGIGGIWAGNRKRYYKRFIMRAFPINIKPDREVLFITYADVPQDTLMWIKDEIDRIVHFEKVVLVQASAAVSSNCGPGAFGIQYMVKTGKSYNLASFFDKEGVWTGEEEIQEDEDEVNHASDEYDYFPIHDNRENRVDKTTEKAWYEGLEGINSEHAVKNSGGEQTLRTVMQIFYSSIDDRSGELDELLNSGDIENYTIKVHALKSSARLIGADETADMAQLLENAGNERDIEYIEKNHRDLILKFRSYKDILGPLFEADRKDEDLPGTQKNVLDDNGIRDIYDRLDPAVRSVNCDEIEKILRKAADYNLPDEDRERIRKLSEMSELFNYDGMLEILENMKR